MLVFTRFPTLLAAGILPPQLLASSIAYRRISFIFAVKNILSSFKLRYVVKMLEIDITKENSCFRMIPEVALIVAKRQINFWNSRL